MTPGARLSAAIEILDQVEADPRPADRVVEAYFRQRRYAGSKDRHAVAERAYGVLRRRRRIDWRLVMADWQAAPTGRTRVLAAMALAGGSALVAAMLAVSIVATAALTASCTFSNARTSF